VGIAERRERVREEVRRKILDAAHELFATEGYDHVTMRRIAEAIEYSPTTIYLHFKDKDQLVHELCQEDFAKLLAELSRQKPPADPKDALVQLGRGYARFGVSFPNHYRFMFLTPFGPGHEPTGAGLQAFELVRAAVAEAIAAGGFRTDKVDVVAQVLWASVHGAVALLITYGAEKFPCTPAVPDLVGEVVENALRGFLDDPRAWATKKKKTR
jgi:AcrR family transcriptional regulator